MGGSGSKVLFLQESWVLGRRHIQEVEVYQTWREVITNSAQVWCPGRMRHTTPGVCPHGQPRTLLLEKLPSRSKENAARESSSLSRQSWPMAAFLLPGVTLANTPCKPELQGSRQGRTNSANRRWQGRRARVTWQGVGGSRRTEASSQQPFTPLRFQGRAQAAVGFTCLTNRESGRAAIPSEE